MEEIADIGIQRIAWSKAPLRVSTRVPENTSFWLVICARELGRGDPVGTKDRGRRERRRSVLDVEWPERDTVRE